MTFIPISRGGRERDRDRERERERDGGREREDHAHRRLKKRVHNYPFMCSSA